MPGSAWKYVAGRGQRLAACTLLFMAAAATACQPDDGRSPVPGDRSPARQGPSLATQMLELQLRHASLWFAAEAENWPLVDYMLHEMEELVEDIEETHPTYRNVRIAEMLGEITLPTITEMEEAAARADHAIFVEKYHRLTDACNACHVAADRAVLVIQRPETPPFTNLRYRP